ncbi:MAG: GreA/GreB family elongation factor [Actinomycetota bacterium]|nr:GreA/GreB family elongation factor [Actinomycetota bacterium]MDQ3901348.1 GreA/GreB family elongation factor [Actinomycetota bacterium]
MTETTSSDQARRALTEELEVLRSRRREFADGLDSDDFPGDRADQADAIERLSELQAIERRIDEVTRLLADGADTDRPSSSDQVGVGSIVTLRYKDGATDELRVGTVVNADDASVVTADSPLGLALLGRSAGQDINWSTPTGPREARVVRVSQPSA